MKPFRILLLAALAVSLSGGARKPQLAVHFHVESVGAAGGHFTVPAKFVNPPREGHIEAVPFASERNIAAIFPVENADGTIGCAFKLDQSGKFALETLSKDRRGASIFITMATKTGHHQVIDMVIDKPILDGIIFVPKGITPGELTMLQQLYPIMGQPKKKK
ncbi:MAG TPA: hypothetical protein VFG14_03880 [Chthoniobacteraceae bacterium]|nr:hypothetical protein [Chthoniobacteraceae bacterium]